MAKPSNVGRPASPAVKSNLDVPKGAPPVQRQPSGAVNSPNSAGGEVAAGRYSSKQ